MSKRLTVFDLGVIYIFWGISFIALKIVVDDIPPIAAAGIRYSLAALTIGIFLFIISKTKTVPKPNRKQVLGASVVGFFFLAVAIGMLNIAATQLNASTLALMFAMIPAIISLLELFRSKFNWAVFLAALLGLAGVAVLLISQIDGASWGYYLLAIGTVIIWALIPFFFKSIPLPESLSWNLLIQTTVAASALMLSSLLIGESIEISEVSLSAWGSLLFLGVAVSVIANASLFRLLLHHSPELASTYNFVNPLIAIIAASVILNEKMSSVQLIAASIIIAVSVFVIFYKDNKD